MLTGWVSNIGDLVYIAEVMYNGKEKGKYEENDKYISGTEFSVCLSFTDKMVCREIGKWYTWIGLTANEIAQEIYSHAMAYYYFGNVKKVIGEDLANKLKDHANPINLGGDRFLDSILKVGYKTIWNNTKGT